MPLPLPNLDDRTYDDLVQEAVSLIPTYDPEWTNHNPSDPGITLVELFAFLSEMLMYRLNQVTAANTQAFLRLLNGPDWRHAPGKTLDEEVRETVLAFRATWRAVTPADFETLARAADSQVARARAVARRDLESDDPNRRIQARPSHVSVIVVPQGTGSNPQPSPALLQTVRDALEPARLITTRLHVVKPRYVQVAIRVGLVLTADVLEATVVAQAVAALSTFLHPLTGGEDGTGWPFGRNIYASEIYQLLDKLPGVDYVKDTPGVTFVLSPQDAGRLNNSNVEISEDELVDARIAPGDITTEVPGRT
jgi:phage-related baseplate assembly protein